VCCYEQSLIAKEKQTIAVRNSPDFAMTLCYIEPMIRGADVLSTPVSSLPLRVPEHNEGNLQYRALLDGPLGDVFRRTAHRAIGRFGGVKRIHEFWPTRCKLPQQRPRR
jgi:hypothetical protein